MCLVSSVEQSVRAGLTQVICSLTGSFNKPVRIHLEIITNYGLRIITLVACVQHQSQPNRLRWVVLQHFQDAGK